MKTNLATRTIFLTSLLLVVVAQCSAAPIVAIDVPLQAGNQSFSGSLGTDFNVLAPISVTSLGVFDAGGGALATNLTVYLYNRTTKALVTSVTFARGTTSTLINGDLFSTLGSPVNLAAGFLGSIVADGFNSTQKDGNTFMIPAFTSPTLNTGGGLISFGTPPSVRYSSAGLAGVFPDTVDNSGVLYGAGTFQFQGAGVSGVPEPGSFVLLGSAIGMLGILRLRRRSS